MRKKYQRVAGPSVLAHIEPLEHRTLLSAVTFTAPTAYTIGTGASPAVSDVSADGDATADFNGDGKLDLAVVHTADATVNILLNKGDGTFNSAVRYPTGISNPIWVTISDLNGDGKPDLAVLGNEKLSILLGKGDGTFQTAVTYAAGPVSRGGVAVGDFNGDGKLDLAVAQFGQISSTQSAVDIFINNGNGTFKPDYTVGVPLAARAVAVGDFNGDGKADLAVADGQGYDNVISTTDPAGVTILTGNGDGTFTTAGQFNSVPTPDAGTNGVGGGDIVNPENIYVADLNADGHPDLVETLYDHNIDVFLGAGGGSFATGVGYATGEYPRAVAITDVDGDSKLDLVVGNVGIYSATAGKSENGSIAVLVGNGDGTFQSPSVYSPFAFPGWLVTGDFNGDGSPDIAVTRVQDGHAVNILQNVSLTSIPAPAVTNIDPKSGPAAGGTAVRITGTNFTSGVQVKFGTVNAVSIVVNSATSITAISPAEAAGVVDVVVTSAAGGSPVSTADQFTFVSPVTLPAPVAVSPGTSTSPGPVLATLTPTFAWQAITGVTFTGYQINLYNETTKVSLSYTTGASVTSYTVAATAPLAAGDAYVWNVRALNGGQSGPPSVYLYFQTPPAVVTTLPAPVAISPGTGTAPGPVLTTLTPTLTWQGITGVTFTGYQINLYDSTTGSLATYTTGVGDNVFTVRVTAPLIAGHIYVWNVRALNGAISGPPSNYLNFQAPPSNVTSLPAPVAISPGSTTSPGPLIATLTPTFTWQAISGVTFTGYQINLYNVTTKASTSYTAGVSATSYAVPSTAPLTAGDTYLWNVRALNGQQSGPPSVYLYFQTPPAVVTNLPAPVAVSPGSTTSPGPVGNTLTPTFTWQAITGVTFTGYQINLFNQTTNAFVSYSTGAGDTSFTVPASAPLLAGDIYVWNIRAVNAGQSGPPSAYLYFQTPPSNVMTLPAPVANMPGDAIAPGRTITTLTPLFSWNAISAVTFTGYQIYLHNITTDTTLSYQTGESVTSFTPSAALAPGQFYVWNVRALNGGQSGPPSNYLYFETPASAEVVTATGGGTVQPHSVTTNLPVSAVAGGKIHASSIVTVMNTSAGRFKGSITTQVYASSDGSIDGSSVLLGSVVRKLTLVSGKAAHLVVPIKMLPASLDGTYSVLARTTDFTGAEADSVYGPTLQVAAPFVSLSAVFAPLAANAVKSGATVIVSNIGNTSEVAALSYTVGFSSDSVGQIPVGSSQSTGKTQRVTIKPGKSVKIHIRSWRKLEASLAPGNYFLTVVLTDPSGQSTTAVSETALEV